MLRSGDFEQIVPTQASRRISSLGEIALGKGGAVPSLEESTFSWAEGQPAWQGEAIHRLYLHGELSPEDIAELTLMCRAAHDALEEDEAPPALQATNSPPPGPPGEHDGPVTLLSVSEVDNVNALAAEQELPFASAGLTVIYGDIQGNASGKSGYVRILKQACRARARGDVLPNVFGNDGSPPRARIAYWDDGDELDYVWRAGDEATPAALRAVSIFDGDCAAVYLDVDHEIPYRPFGLDVFDRLAGACDQIRTKLDAQIRPLEARLEQQLDDLEGDHEVGRFIAGLSGDSAVEELDRLAQLSEPEQEQLEELKREIAAMRAEDPLRHAAALESEARRYRRLAELLECAGQDLSDEALAQLRAAQGKVAATREAARLAAEVAFADAPLEGVGEEPWRRLWEAARTYSEEAAYPDKVFPVVGDEAVCVLCQQRLEPAAADRLRGFEEHVRSSVEQDAREAADAYHQKRRAVEEVDLEADETTLDDLGRADEELAGKFHEALERARARRDSLLAACEEDSWDSIPTLGPTPLEDIQALVRQREMRASTLRDGDTGETLQGLLEEHAPLVARRRLCDLRETVAARIATLGRLEALRAARADTDTAAISRESRRLTEEAVSDVVIDALRTELANLGVSSVAVEVDRRSVRGELRHRLKLAGAEPGVRTTNVLSEGEQSAVALAAFLSELVTAPSRSAIVLDDPVTSQDHVHRQRTAGRIVAAAQERQVIVFTHDLVLLFELEAQAAREGVATLVRQVRISPDGYGASEPGVPWPGMKARDRITHLRELALRAGEHREGSDQTTYEAFMSHTIEHLREAWERAVEEVVMAGVVMRFQRDVKTTKVRYLIDLTEADYREIDRGMSFASRAKHDDPMAAADPLPTVEDIEREIERLASFVRDVHRRRN